MPGLASSVTRSIAAPLGCATFAAGPPGPPRNERAALDGQVESAQGAGKHESTVTPAAVQLERASDGCRKAAAVALYTWGVLPLERVERMFVANPRWRHA
jgi:hypothetical protein